MSEGKLEIYLRCKSADFVREYKFLPDRRFRFDFAIPERKIAFEYEGGTFVKSRHTTGIGYARDCEKYSLAAIAGWRVVRITGSMFKTGVAFTLIDAALEIDK